MTRWIAESSEAGGREARNPSYDAPSGASSDQVTVLGVHQQQRAQPRDLGHRALELSRRDVRELRDPGVEEEALEAEHSRVVQTGQVTEVVRHRTTPEADVDRALPPRGRALGLEGLDGDRRRHGVQRHVHDRGDATRGRGTRRGLEALPLGPPGLVDVDVRVDQSRDQHLVAGEGHRTSGGRRVVVRRESRDASAGDPDAHRPLDALDDRPAGAHDEVELSCHGRWSSRRGSAATARGSGSRPRRP